MDNTSEWRATNDWPYHICAGGIIFRNVSGMIEIAVLVRHENDGDHYHLPKGTLGHNETLEDCALRETLEEGGKSGKIIGYLGAIHDQFTHPKTTIFTDKTTHYFAMEIIRETELHDHEHDDVRWVEIKKARELLETTEQVKQEFLIVDRLLKLFEIVNL